MHASVDVRAAAARICSVLAIVRTRAAASIAASAANAACAFATATAAHATKSTQPTNAGEPSRADACASHVDNDAKRRKEYIFAEMIASASKL